MAEFVPSEDNTPYARLGGEAAVRAVAERFYDAMEQLEPELAALHVCEGGKVSRSSRDRFGLFLIGWLGGAQTYTAQHGHPRLRMRHGHIPMNARTRDAWLRCMRVALAHESVEPELRAWLDKKFSEVAEFLSSPG